MLEDLFSNVNGLRFPSAGLLVEIATILACGGAAWWLFRISGKWRDAKLWPHAPVRLKTVTLRILAAVTFPLAWSAILLAIHPFLSPWLESLAWVNRTLLFLGFFILFQVVSVGISILLPQRHFTRMMIRLALALGLGVLAFRLVGWYHQIIAALEFPFLSLGPASLTLSVILKSLFLAWALFLAAGQISTFLQNRIINRTDLDPALSFAMMRFFKFFLFGLGVLVILDTIGVDLSTLTIFGGALGIGLGFGLQNIANNFVSGLLLLMDRSIKQGDVITVGDSYGWVVRLGARYIVVRTRDGVEKLIPNSNLITSEITNWSHSDRAVRLHIKVGVSYDSDPYQVQKYLLRVAETNPRVLKKPQPNVLFIDFGDSSLDFELRVWINDPEGGIESVRSALRFEIWKVFKENGIQIPFPQRDLHIKSGREPLPFPGPPESGSEAAPAPAPAPKPEQEPLPPRSN